MIVVIASHVDNAAERTPVNCESRDSGCRLTEHWSSNVRFPALSGNAGVSHREKCNAGDPLYGLGEPLKKCA